MIFVIDTNVILIANGQHKDVSGACVVSCVQKLGALIKNGRIAIDDRYRILKEYQNKTTPNLGNLAGNAFVKWLLRNNTNPNHCEQVTLVENAERGFESFPDDERLVKFDDPDRKFVAVAAAHPNKPVISQAADSKWVEWEPALRDHGITVDFLCPRDIQGFDDKKRGRKGKQQ